MTTGVRLSAESREGDRRRIRKNSPEETFSGLHSLSGDQHVAAPVPTYRYGAHRVRFPIEWGGHSATLPDRTGGATGCYYRTRLALASLGKLFRQRPQSRRAGDPVIARASSSRGCSERTT